MSVSAVRHAPGVRLSLSDKSLAGILVAAVVTQPQMPGWLSLTAPVAALTGQCSCHRQTHPVVLWAVVYWWAAMSFQSYPLAVSVCLCPRLLYYVLAISSCCFSSVLTVDTDFYWICSTYNIWEKRSYERYSPFLPWSIIKFFFWQAFVDKRV